MAGYVNQAVGGLPTFVPLRLSDALSAGVPEDPNSILNATVEDAAGWSVEIETAAAVDGLREGVWYRFPLPAAWRADGTQILAAKLTPVVIPAANSDWWVGFGWADNNGLFASTPTMAGGGWRATSAALAGQPIALSEVTASSSAEPAGWSGNPDGATRVRLVPYGTDDDGLMGSTIAFSKSVGDLESVGRGGLELAALVGTRVMVLGFGVNAINTGFPDTGKFLVEIAVVDIEAAGAYP